MPDLVEIPGIDFVEARLGQPDAEQLTPWGQPARNLWSQVAVAIPPVELRGKHLHSPDARHRGELVANRGTAGLDIDPVAAAENSLREFGHAPRQCDPPAIE